MQERLFYVRRREEGFAGTTRGDSKMYVKTTLRSLGALALATLLLSVGSPAQATHTCDCNSIPTLGAALDYPAMSLFKNVNISGAAYAENGSIGLVVEAAK